ncbi:MAG: hypothetical protein V4592_03730 [Bacteroidota bacterium]
MNTTSYRDKLTGFAKSCPSAAMAVTVQFVTSNLEYAFLQNSKDFIN